MCHSTYLATYLRMVIVSAMLSIGATLHAAEPYDGLPTRYFEFITNNQHVEAIDLVEAETYCKLTDAHVEMFRRFKDKAAKTAVIVGEYRFHEVLTEERFGTRLVRLTYIGGFENEPLTYTLLLYRPGDKWKFRSVEFHAFNFDADPQALKVRSP